MHRQVLGNEKSRGHWAGVTKREEKQDGNRKHRTFNPNKAVVFGQEQVCSAGDM